MDFHAQCKSVTFGINLLPSVPLAILNQRVSGWHWSWAGWETGRHHGDWSSSTIHHQSSWSAPILHLAHANLLFCLRSLSHSIILNPQYGCLESYFNPQVLLATVSLWYTATKASSSSSQECLELPSAFPSLRLKRQVNTCKREDRLRIQRPKPRRKWKKKT